MNVYLTLYIDGTDKVEELKTATKDAQRIADMLNVTVELRNGEYGSYVVPPTMTKEVNVYEHIDIF